MRLRLSAALISIRAEFVGDPSQPTIRRVTGRLSRQRPSTVAISRRDIEMIAFAGHASNNISASRATGIERFVALVKAVGFFLANGDVFGLVLKTTAQGQR